VLGRSQKHASAGGASHAGGKRCKKVTLSPTWIVFNSGGILQAALNSIG
jgi:hypothetical protein